VSALGRGRRALGALGCVLLLASCGPEVERSTPEVERVLVFSMPGVTWDDVARAELPNLERFIEEAAIGDVSTRIGRQRTSTSAGYLTIGAGTRAVVPGVDTGVALNPDELHGGIPAADLLRRRLGRTVSGIAYIPVGATIDANEASAFGAEPGLLGDHLADAGVHRAVIANADAAEGFPTDQPPPDGAFARSAATALMGSDGVVPGGNVGRGLLLDDPDAPFGRRLDSDAVVTSFEQEWDEPGQRVVLVEASDLSRAAAYGSRATPSQARTLRAEALRESDVLLGRLLDRTDPDDAVLVVSPVTPSTLGIAALRAPDLSAGLLRSASTRRDGYVYLADVAPTILELTGIEPPTSIEGRAFDVAEVSGDRIGQLIDQADDAATRDERLPVIVPIVIGLLVLLAIAVRQRAHLSPRANRALRPLTYAALGILPGTFVAGLVPATRTSDLAYVGAITVVAALVAAGATAVDRRWPGAGPIAAVGSVIGLITVDVLLGAPLQVNSLFGYSMAVAGRFTGLGNLAFAIFASAAVCLAVLIFERGGARALGAIAGLLAAAVVVDGLPMLGADVGGVIATVPAFVLTLLVLHGRRVGWREVAASLALGLAMVALFGLIDSSRPAGSQTHLARIGEHVANGRLGSVGTILWRRVHASFGGDQALITLLAVAVVAVAVVQAVLVARGRWRRRDRRPLDPAEAALVVGGSTLAALGLVANDSSIAVPATMLLVIGPVVLLRRLDADPGSAGPAPRAEAPS
jgi:hypothetical protein